MSAMPEFNGVMTEADYLVFERASDMKHELLNGEIYAMSGASRAHNLIVGSTYVTLYTQLRGKGCELYPSDMKVRTPATKSYTYPDITVVCGEAQFSDRERDTLLNPTVIIEVLSPNTERYDRGRKFQHYRELESLQEYVLIAQDSPHIEKYLRQADGFWQFSEATGLEDEIALVSIHCKLTLAEVYEQITFTTAENDEV